MRFGLQRASPQTLSTGQEPPLALGSESRGKGYTYLSCGGGSPIELAALVLPDGLLESLGVAPVPLDEVVLRPRLVAHAVEL